MYTSNVWWKIALRVYLCIKYSMCVGVPYTTFWVYHPVFLYMWYHQIYCDWSCLFCDVWRECGMSVTPIFKRPLPSVEFAWYWSLPKILEQIYLGTASTDNTVWECIFMFIIKMCTHSHRVSFPLSPSLLFSVFLSPSLCLCMCVCLSTSRGFVDVKHLWMRSSLSIQSSTLCCMEPVH